MDRDASVAVRAYAKKQNSLPNADSITTSIALCGPSSQSSHDQGADVWRMFGEASNQFAERVCVIDGATKLTYKDFRDRVLRSVAAME